MGGVAVLYALDLDMTAQYFAERFRAAVAYYPGCITLPRFTAPVAILIGEADDWTPAERCRDMVRHARPDSAPIAMTVYPGAHHAFDVVQLQPGRQVYGHWIEYNDAAAEDAEVRVRTFLATHLEPAAAQEAARRMAWARPPRTAQGGRQRRSRCHDLHGADERHRDHARSRVAYRGP
jgi:dienelactone hydrolase